MTAKSISIPYLVVTHLVSLFALILYLIGSLIAVSMSFDAGIHVGTIILHTTLIIIPMLAIILAAIFSWRFWKWNNLKWANGLTVINWGIIIIVMLLCSG